jgi:hypothetical protein
MLIQCIYSYILKSEEFENMTNNTNFCYSYYYYNLKKLVIIRVIVKTVFIV